MPFRPLPQQQAPLLPGGTLGGFRVINPVDRGQEIRQEEGIKSQINIGEAKAKKKMDLEFKAQEPMGSDTAKTFQYAVDGIMNIEKIRERAKNGSSFVLPQVFDRDLSAMSTDLADVIGRLRSGGAIQGREEENFRSLLPSIADPRAVKINKLNRLEAKFRNLGSQMSSKDRLEAALSDSRKMFDQGGVQAPSLQGEVSQQNQQTQPQGAIYQVDDNGTTRYFKAKTPEEIKKLESLGGMKVQ